jgi:hypothetical protein
MKFAALSYMEIRAMAHIGTLRFTPVRYIAALCVTSIVSLTICLHAQSPATIAVTDPTEASDYNAAKALNSTTALENFIQKYPNSSTKNPILDYLVATYRNQGDAPKAYDAAARLLQSDPNNLRAITLIAFRDQHDAQRDLGKLGDAAKLARHGLAVAKATYETDVDFAALRVAAVPVLNRIIASYDVEETAHAVLASHPLDVPLSNNDLLAILTNGSLDDAKAAWERVKGHSLVVTGNVTEATATSVEVEVPFIELSRGRATLQVVMKSPLSQVPLHGDNKVIVGTLSTFSNDGTIALTDGEVREVQPPTPIAVSAVEDIITGPPSSLFTWDTDLKVGDCHILPGARLELTGTAHGYNLHFTAQMKTDKSLFGDTFHITWTFKDAAGHVLLVSHQVDLPDGASMHPQFGNYNVDYNTSIGPDTEPNIDHVIESVGGVVMDSAC